MTASEIAALAGAVLSISEVTPRRTPCSPTWLLPNDATKSAGAGKPERLIGSPIAGFAYSAWRARR